MTNLGHLKVAFAYAGVERQKTFIIIKNAGGETLIETHVKRAIHDTHDKVLGRFFAFKKAMNQLVLRNLATRAQRAEAWLMYKEMIKVPTNINLTLPRKEVKAKAVKA